MSQRKKIFTILIPVLILISGVMVMKYLVSHRPPPKKEVKTQPGALAEIIIVHPGKQQINIFGTGTVQPRQAASIAPQVSGKVEEVNSKLVVGGFFSTGELLFSIEEVDYQLAVQSATANLIKANVEVLKIKSLAKVARQEWKRLQPDSKQEPNPLVLYEPQLQGSIAQQTAARAQLEQAEINLERTKIRAPFNCFIHSEKIDSGQYVRAGNSVIEISGTDSAEIIVPLPHEVFRWLDIPRGRRAQKGSLATVTFADQQQTYEYPGQLVRTLGEVDPRGRMSRLVVAVDDPYHLRKKPQHYLPELEIGMFVDVNIHGRQLENIISLPRDALRDHDTVWVVGKDDILQIKAVTIIYREQKTVLISAGLDDGDRVVLTNLNGAAKGMKLRPVPRGNQS
ncbi:MAG: efflux RND transporter periplasmic adaptor subunit [Xanthomonadaceae bacterium]|nr:efflux RND transporter periplasmic adaptor subunit [Xanthomonadaceae bacterium]